MVGESLEHGEDELGEMSNVYLMAGWPNGTDHRDLGGCRKVLVVSTICRPRWVGKTIVTKTVSTVPHHTPSHDNLPSPNGL